jgi:predicted transcriptional regulator
MAGRKVLAITERQFAVLRVLWEHGPLTARALMEYLPRGDRQPYTTVLGLLQTMEKAGLVDHEKQGVVHLYRPTDSRQEATGNLLTDFLAKFFHGSAEQLILGLVDAKALAPGDLRAIEARLARAQGGVAPKSENAGAKPRAKSRKKTP